MKSSFDQEIQRLMQENVFDNLASGAWGGVKAVGRGLGTVANAAYGVSGGREAVSQLGQAAGDVKKAMFGTQSSAKQPGDDQQTPAPTTTTARPLKSITSIDNKVKDTLNASGLNPADKAVLQSQLPALFRGLSSTVTDQDLISIITTTLSKK